MLSGTASRRLQVVTQHLSGRSSSNVAFEQCAGNSSKRGDDIVIVGAVRTALCKGKKGAFKDTHWTHLLAAVLREVVVRSKVSAADVEDVQVGTVLARCGGATEARMAAFNAGIPYTAAVTTTNRQCASGLQAVANIASALQAGYIRVGIAAGVESMSLSVRNTEFHSQSLVTQEAKDCTLPMGITSENVASDFGISREAQDEFAFQSQAKAMKAQDANLFQPEIVPVTTTVLDPVTGASETVVVRLDEGIRPTTREGLKNLKPAFNPKGCSTAGNSSQVTDGASAILLTTRDEALKRGLPILGKFLTYAVVGVPPRVMGVGPAYAIPKALEQAGLSADQIDIFEINEAFASQALYCIDKLGIDKEKVNPQGGAIALGHPLGCTGARLVTTILNQLRTTNQRFGVVSMCVGSGMGAAAVLEAEEQIKY